MFAYLLCVLEMMCLGREKCTRWFGDFFVFLCFCVFVCFALGIFYCRAAYPPKHKNTKTQKHIYPTAWVLATTVSVESAFSALAARKYSFSGPERVG